MAGTITITCGQCKKVMQVPEVLAGKRIRCRGCEATLTVKKPVPQAAPVKAAAGSNDEWGPAQAYGIDKLDEQMRCAFCAVDMEDGQIVCLNCGYNMQTRERHGTRVVHAQTGGDYTLWHLPTFLCFLVILACIACLVIIWTGRPYLGGFWGENIQDWRWGRVYSSAFLAFIIFSAGRFVYKRLIHQLHPPEIEKHAHQEHKVDD